LPWDDPKFERFANATIRMARGELPGYGYPHVVLPYPPAEERACIEQLRGLPGRLGQAGLPAALVPVCRHVGQAVRRFATRSLEDGDEYVRLQADLSDPRTGVGPKAAGLCAQGLAATGARDGIVILGRLGALYPFAHVSTFLESLQQELQRQGMHQTLAVAYPGSAEGTRLRFLGLVDPTGGYRGHVVT
jgi:hypothetical protein